MNNEDMDYNQLYKSSSHKNVVILVGDTGVGKTHLLNKYVKGVLPRNPVPTIGVEFATKTVTLKNGERVKAQIWDTGND
jgi:GTPase SAR1 family protein